MVAQAAIMLQRERAAAAKGRKPKAPVHEQTVKTCGQAAYRERKDTAVVRILLPVPVSVNAIYAPRKGGGLRLSDAYSAWIRDAGWRLIEQRPGRVAGRYQITVWIPEECGCDLDNTVKCVSDLMQLHGVVRNDRLAARVVLEWHDRHSEAVVEVRAYNSGADAVRSVDDVELEEIRRAVEACGSLTEAAQRLGIGRSTLYRKLKAAALPSSDSLIVRREA